MTPNEEILDRLVRHLHYLERYKAAEVRRIVTILNRADRDLAKLIEERLATIGRGADLSKAETDRLNALLASIRSNRDELAASLTEEARQELNRFAEHEAEFKLAAIESAAAVELTKPSLSKLHAVVTARPFQGRFLREWYQDLADKQRKAVSSAIRMGVIEGQTTEQIVRRIRGTKAQQYADGIMQTGRRETAAVVRTAIAHVANAASETLYAENAELIQGVQWVSVLDSRTTTLCASRDGKIFPIDKGPRPPAHWNCRSTTIPYLGVMEGSRASQFGAVPRETTYENWLRRQPSGFQDDVLGKGRAKLFREGRALDSFVDPTGREYTLDQLRAADTRN